MNDEVEHQKQTLAGQVVMALTFAVPSMSFLSTCAAVSKITV